MADLHEAREDLSEACLDLHRAINSLREELEAVDWYQQRVEVCHDPELRSVLEHNRDEEIEHACMTIEWLRRKAPTWEENLRKYLFSSGPIVGMEHGAAPAEHDEGGRGLGLGKLGGVGS